MTLSQQEPDDQVRDLRTISLWMDKVDDKLANLQLDTKQQAERLAGLEIKIAHPPKRELEEIHERVSKGPPLTPLPEHLQASAKLRAEFDHLESKRTRELADRQRVEIEKLREALVERNHRVSEVERVNVNLQHRLTAAQNELAHERQRLHQQERDCELRACSSHREKRIDELRAELEAAKDKLAEVRKVRAEERDRQTRMATALVNANRSAEALRKVVAKEAEILGDCTCEVCTDRGNRVQALDQGLAELGKLLLGSIAWPGSVTEP